MLLCDWIKTMERIAPPELAMEWDNPGLLVSPEEEALTTVLVALDCTVPVAEEAAAVHTTLPSDFPPMEAAAHRRHKVHTTGNP